MAYGVIEGIAPLGDGEPSNKFFLSWMTVEYGPGLGRNSSSYAPYFREDVGPFEEIEVHESTEGAQFSPVLVVVSVLDLEANTDKIATSLLVHTSTSNPLLLLLVLKWQRRPLPSPMV